MFLVSISVDVMKNNIINAGTAEAVQNRLSVTKLNAYFSSFISKIVEKNVPRMHSHTLQ